MEPLDEVKDISTHLSDQRVLFTIDRRVLEALGIQQGMAYFTQQVLIAPNSHYTDSTRAQLFTDQS